MYILPSGVNFVVVVRELVYCHIYYRSKSIYSLLVGITEINPSGGIVTGYVYPDLDNEQYIMAVVHIGCIYH